jgi:uncharacterized protein
MKKVIFWLNDSIYTNPLSPACKMCAKGSKMVILITGLCSAKCFYCPLSLKKLGKDKIFADEWELKDENDIEKLLQEAKYIKATGAGITGGDPLIVWKRTINYIELLKNKFGDSFNIHLYTAGIDNSVKIADIVDSGLDEIRFHPQPYYWNKMQKSKTYFSIKSALKKVVDVAIEIPAIPGMEKQIISLIKWANENSISWVNLNELEFSETNAKQLMEKGFDVKDDISAAVKGSQESAIEIIKEISKQEIDIGLHYCSSSFKDGVQLKNRIKRRAKSIVKDFEIITDEGTILKGVIYAKNISLEKIYFLLTQKYGISKNKFFINKDKNRIDIDPLILEKIAKELNELGFSSFIIEEYPTADALEVEKSSLPL